MTSRLLHIALLSVLALCSCTGLKNINSDNRLYTGNKYELDTKDKNAARVVEQTNNELKPKPNNKFLWMRPALARYNMLSDSARVKKFWKNKVDEPVRMSNINGRRTARILENRLFHAGYFSNQVQFDTLKQGNKRSKLQFNITLNEPHRFGVVRFPAARDTLTMLVARSAPESLLVPGEIYSLQTLKDERKRIDDYLREYGYIYFNPDFIQFKADSVTTEHVVNVELYIKPTIPPESRLQYEVDRILIFDEQLDDNIVPDTISAPPYYLITADSTLRMSAIKRGIFVKPGELYSRSDRLLTSRYLNRLPIIRSATTNFVPGSDSTQLDALIKLNKHKRFAYSAEFNTIFRSTNYFGPGVVFSITDRNLRGLAERLQLNLRGRFEVQIADGVVNPAYELGIELNYMLPRLAPRFLESIGRSKLPQTRISTGYNLFNRLDLYRLNSLFFDFGYQWRRSDKISMVLDPIEIIFTSIPESSKSDKFLEYLEDNPGVERSFDEQFVVGSGYEIIFDPPPGYSSDFYLRAGVNFAGNVMSLMYSAFNAEKDSSGRYTLFGVPFSQFIQTRLDMRYGYYFSNKSSLHTRFVTGIGVPLSNSDILPYIKQFYVGGTNSLRSFLARSIGPGAVEPPKGFTDLTGDIRLEWNLEYRFTVSGKLKGALFMDAGNIWLFNEDPARPGGHFTFSTFLDQVAVSAGYGLRWDFNFVVARLDLAYTVRTPYLPEGERWTSNFKFWSPTWNIAIGYPF